MRKTTKARRALRSRRTGDEITVHGRRLLEAIVERKVKEIMRDMDIGKLVRDEIAAAMRRV